MTRSSTAPAPPRSRPAAPPAARVAGVSDERRRARPDLLDRTRHFSPRRLATATWRPPPREHGESRARSRLAPITKATCPRPQIHAPTLARATTLKSRCAGSLHRESPVAQWSTVLRGPKERRSSSRRSRVRLPSGDGVEFLGFPGFACCGAGCWFAAGSTSCRRRSIPRVPAVVVLDRTASDAERTNDTYNHRIGRGADVGVEGIPLRDCPRELPAATPSRWLTTCGRTKVSHHRRGRHPRALRPMAEDAIRMKCATQPLQGHRIRANDPRAKRSAAPPRLPPSRRCTASPGRWPLRGTLSDLHRPVCA